MAEDVKEKLERRLGESVEFDVENNDVRIGGVPIDFPDKSHPMWDEHKNPTDIGELTDLFRKLKRLS